MAVTRDQKRKAAQGGLETAPANDEAMPSGAEATSASGQATSSNDKAIPYSKEETPAKHYQPHDKFVKRAFEDIGIARDFFAAHLKNLESEPADEDLVLNPEDFANFKPSSGEHMRAWENKIISDVIYHGTIDGQDYYIDMEHQSTRDRTMFDRFLDYTIALFKKHTAQDRSGWPVVLSICLYHDPIKDQPWGKTTTLQRCFINKKHAKRSPIKPIFKLVDLVAMSDETISTHNKAAIVELALKYAYKRDSNKKNPQKGRKEYFAYIVNYIKKQINKNKQINTNTEDNFMGLKESSKDALIEYMSYVCKGSNSLKNIKEVVTDLLTAIPELPPEEKAIMETTVDRLRQETLQEGIQRGMQQGMQQGIQQGIHERDLQIAQMIQHLVQEYGVKLETIKASAPVLVNEVMTHVSPDETESSSLSQALQGTANVELLGQSITGTPEPATSGSINSATASNSELGSLSQVNKAARAQ